MKIHPTAIIDSTAELHESVEVGPYTIIEKNVKIDEGTVISSCCRIYEGTRIGKNNKIFHNVMLGALPQDLGFDPSEETHTIIGDNNTFHEGNQISRGTRPDSPTTIGSNNFFMGNFHLGHDSSIGSNNILTQGAVVAGHVHIGNRVFISGLAAVHQFCRIGDFAMLAGLSKVTKDVPPFCTVDGNPAGVISINSVGLRRAGFSSEQRNAIREAYKVVYHSDLITSQAVQHLKNMEHRIEEVDYIIHFLEESARGITDHH